MSFSSTLHFANFPEKPYQIEECIPVGCVPSAVVAVCVEGEGGLAGVRCVSAQRGVSARGGVSAQVGVCLPRGCVSGRVHPPVDRQTPVKTSTQ